jgi:hypothetical protein
MFCSDEGAYVQRENMRVGPRDPRPYMPKAPVSRNACSARPDLHTVRRSFPKISSALSAKVCGGSKLAKILIQALSNPCAAAKSAPATGWAVIPRQPRRVRSVHRRRPINGARWQSLSCRRMESVGWWPRTRQGRREILPPICPAGRSAAPEWPQPRSAPAPGVRPIRTTSLD